MQQNLEDGSYKLENGGRRIFWIMTEPGTGDMIFMSIGEIFDELEVIDYFKSEIPQIGEVSMVTERNARTCDVFLPDDRHLAATVVDLDVFFALGSALYGHGHSPDCEHHGEDGPDRLRNLLIDGLAI